MHGSDANREDRIMRHVNPLLAAALCFGSLQLTACDKKAHTQSHESPAKVEHLEGSELSRVTLTERAMERLDLKTSEVREQAMSRSATPRRVVPYSSLIYDPTGKTWVYTRPQPLTFIRHKVDVEYIEGDAAVLSDGPPAGTVVATVGAAELYGTEFAVGH
jgi:hypothetical protein